MKLPSENFRFISPFDLHVLSTPPAFILSQDQTLVFKFSPVRINSWLILSFLLCLVSFFRIFSFSLRIFGVGIYCSIIKVLLLLTSRIAPLGLSLSATAHLFYHSFFALSTTFLNFFRTFCSLPLPEAGNKGLLGGCPHAPRYNSIP